jgi:hypothetical protein
MQEHRGHVSVDHHPYIQALRSRHSMLERQIRDEQKSPAANEALLRALKLKKLMLKDEISQHEKITG